ncbi:MAG: iron transporter [Clostridia bacterium]|nr:iron transporter [Clostridia bacterium]
MKKYAFSFLLIIVCLALAACGRGQAPAVDTATEPAGGATATDAASVTAALPDGVYSADFKTDGSMFHVNEAHHGKGVLTVANGQMTIHVSLPSKNTVNLFLGTAEDAQKDGAVLLQPTTDTVTYDDGETEEVYGFDIPVPYLDEEFDCALIGTKGVWYDHKVSVSNAVKIVDDGAYTMEVTMTGGTGKASVNSPANITVENGEFTAEIVWSSSHYEYMTVDGVQYDPVNTEGNSTFLIPITPDTDITVQALTTAMSEPHLIEYVLHFDGATLTEK